MKFSPVSAGVLLSTALWTTFALAGSVTVSQSDNGSHQSLVPGDTFVVRLKSNLTTGYRWSVTTADPTLLRKKPEQYKRPVPGKVGQGGVQIFMFTALKPGETSVLLGYSRPFEKHAAPAKTFRVEISVTAAAPAVAKAHASKPPPANPDGVLIGKYVGVLPCADCSRIHTTLLLYAKNGSELIATRYQLQTIYVGAREGDKTMQQAGDWTILRGTRAAPDATVYQLNPEKPAEVSNYLLRGDTLMPLDRMQRPIEAPMDLSLHQEH